MGGLESVDLTEAQIDEINRRSLLRTASPVYSIKAARGITTATFIIPVEEGWSPATYTAVKTPKATL